MWNADEMGVCIGYVGVFIDSPDAQTHDPFIITQKTEGGPCTAVSLGGSILVILARMDGPGITISIILFFDRVFLLQRLRVRLDPSKNRHLNRLKLAQIRFAHL